MLLLELEADLRPSTTVVLVFVVAVVVSPLLLAEAEDEFDEAKGQTVMVCVPLCCVVLCIIPACFVVWMK